MKKIFIFAAAALLVLGFSTSSWAVADFAIGGSARLDTDWRFTDLGDTQGIGNEDSQTQFELFNPGNGRVNFKATVDDVTGFFELAMGDTNVSIRHAYASWDMGGGQSLLFGHTWSIAGFAFTDQRMAFDNGNVGAGALYFGRNPQLRYTYAVETFTLELSAEDNRIAAAPAPLVAAGYIAEDIIPALSASVNFAPIEMLTLTPSVFYQMYDLTGIAAATRDIDVDAWALELDGRLNFEMFRISFQGWFGQNLGIAANSFDWLRAGAGATVAMGTPVANAAVNDVEDVSAYGGFVQLTFPMETMLFNIGGGYQESDVENPGAGWESDMTIYSFFVNVLYNLTDNMYIQPEISYFDFGDDANKNAFGAGRNDLGTDLYVGVHWQADF